MSSPHILTDTTPVIDPAAPQLVRSVITDAWGLVFAQGGVVMAAALRGMQAVLGREDLTLTSASATFCRPVACGPVTTTVEVLRNGRRGAQVSGRLRDESAGDETSVALSAVFTDPTLTGPSLTPLSLPSALANPPAPTEAGERIDSDFPLGFLDNTEWQVVEGPGTDRSEVGAVPRAAVWFRFNEPPAPTGVNWDPALLPIPGDALGTAVQGALPPDEPMGSVSLQIDLQVVAPVEGTWIGIDSYCTRLGNGLAGGVLNLWSEAGVHVATVTQTAMLRRFA